MFQNISYAYDSKWHETITLYGGQLCRFDYEPLYKILERCESGEISLEKCVIDGIKFLKDNEEKIAIGTCDREASMKLKYHTPIKFLGFVYANYQRLSPTALNELQSSLWDLTPFINKSFTSDEIELLKSNGIRWKYRVGNITRETYDIVDAFQKLVDAGKMTKAEAGVHMYLIYSIARNRPADLPFKYNIECNKFSQSESNINGWIRENLEEIKNDKKAFRIIEILVVGFDSELMNYLHKLKNEHQNKNR